MNEPTRCHTTGLPMDAETLEALKGSIAKWEGIVAGTARDEGANNCPLCQKFATEDGCAGCPVAERTLRYGCHGTPYYEFSEGNKAGEQQMLDFLKSLLPTDAIPDETRCSFKDELNRPCTRESGHSGAHHV